MQNTPETVPKGARGARWKLLAILAVCAIPVIASYFTYYVIRPEGRTNYGELIDPMPALEQVRVSTPDGAPADLSAVTGKWVMVTIDPGDCAQPCRDRLWAMRQVRLTAGKDRDRVERLLLLTGEASPPAALMAEHEGLVVLRTSAASLGAAFPAPDGAVAEHVYMVDPLGNVMLRFPAGADPSRMKKDLAKLLRASRIG